MGTGLSVRGVLILLSQVWLIILAQPASAAFNTTADFVFLQSMAENVRIRDICCGKTEQWRKPQKPGTIALSTGPDPLWLKFLPFTQKGVIAISNIPDLVELYRIDAGGNPVLVDRAGDTIPASQRRILATITGLRVGDRELGKTLILKIVQYNRETMQLHFVDKATFLARSSRDDFIRMMLFGAIGMMILFNIAVSLIAREIAFFFNAASVASLLALSIYLSGFGAAWLWPEAPWIANRIMALSIASATLFGGLFVVVFVRPLGDMIMNKRGWLLFLALFLVMVTAGFTLDYWQFVLVLYFLALTSQACLIAGTVYLAIQGNIRARIIIVPLFFVMVPGLVSFSISRITGWQTSPIQHLLLETTLCAEALAFSLALSWRLRLAEQERAIAADELVIYQTRAGHSLLELVDRERRRIASDLHDTAGQGLMMIANRLGNLARQFKAESTARKGIAEAEVFSRNVIDDIRRISHELHPAAIDHLGWHKAIEQLFAGLSDIHNIKVDLKNEIDEPLLDKNQQLHVYRIVQEITNNIATHSHASSCVATFRLDGKTITIKICDDGIYEEKDAVFRPGYHEMSLGQTIVNHRVGVLSGNWHTKPASPGLCVCIEFPATISRGRQI